MTVTDAAVRGARRLGIATAMRDLDEALARAVRLEVEAQEWRIKYLQAAEENAELKAQVKFMGDTANELVRMVDTLRAERDTARATGR